MRRANAMTVATFESAWTYNRRGMAAHLGGRLAEAVAAYSLAIACDTSFADAYANRAAARGQLGDMPGAFADFAAALRLAPDSPDALNNRGTLRRRLGDTSAAMRDFDRAIELNPEHADARANRAVLHHLAWNHAAAVEDLTHALAAPPGTYGIEPRRHLLTVFRGDAFYHLDRTAEAMADYRWAFAARPDAFASLVCRTIAATVRDHGAEKILADCDRHLVRDPNDVLSMARRTVVLLNLARTAEADAERERCYRAGDLADAELFEALLDRARRTPDAV
jgi:tetratricopeptide (TPR) repeat protein